jgi:hypothetical protein
MSSSSKFGGPLEDRAARFRIWQDRQRALEFVKLLLPMLDGAAVERARSVRLRPHDPARNVLEDPPRERHAPATPRIATVCRAGVCSCLRFRHRRH